MAAALLPLPLIVASVSSSEAFISPSASGRTIRAASCDLLTSSSVLCPHKKKRQVVLFEQQKGGGDGTNGTNEEFEGGEALAKEFYDLVRSKEEASSDISGSSAADESGQDSEREEYRRLLGYEQEGQQQSPSSTQQPSSPKTPDEVYEVRKRDAFSTRREVRVSKDGVPTSSSSPTRKKFTGASPRLDSMGSPSAGLFSGRGGSVFSYPGGASSTAMQQPQGAGGTDARSKMMQREFNLVSWAAGAGQAILAAVLVVSLVTVVYIGATGGITDGSERFVEASEFNVIGDFTESGNGITPEDWKDVVPQKLDGASVWL